MQVLGIDEVRRGRPKWEFDEVTQSWQTVVDRWHVGFVDLSGGHGLLGQVEGRTAATVVDWLAAHPKSWREQVRFVAIDMCTVFKSAIRQALPHVQLIRAGLVGGKGVPATVASHPAVFVTLTAPSFGYVHTRRTTKTGQAIPCRPRRKAEACPHGVDLTCNRIHKEGEHVLGQPFCLDCYHHEHQVVWNHTAGELWRRTTIALNRELRRILQGNLLHRVSAGQTPVRSNRTPRTRSSRLDPRFTPTLMEPLRLRACGPLYAAWLRQIAVVALVTTPQTAGNQPFDGTPDVVPLRPYARPNHT